MMKKFLTKVKNQISEKIMMANVILRSQCGENFVDSAIKILIAVVLGALLLAGLYTLFGDTVLPTLRQRIQDMFNYSD